MGGNPCGDSDSPSTVKFSICTSIYLFYSFYLSHIPISTGSSQSLLHCIVKL